MARAGRALVIGSGPNGLVCAIRLAAGGSMSPCSSRLVPRGAASPPSRPRSRASCTTCAPGSSRWGRPRRRSEGWASSATGSSGSTRRCRRRTLSATDGRSCSFPPVLPGLLLGVKLGRRSLELARLMLGSAANLGRELFDHPAPTAWLCGSAAHSDLSPGDAGGAAFAFALSWLGHFVGWPIPRGGAGRLSEAMVGRIAEAGGRVRLRRAGRADPLPSRAASAASSWPAARRSRQMWSSAPVGSGSCYLTRLE